MTVTNFKIHFFKELKSLYPQTEIQSFFNILIEFQLNLNRVDAILNPNLKISENDLTFFFKAVEDLKSQKPIQYITGETEFYGLKFSVNKNVLIPRPETEELVQWIFNTLKTKNKKLKILDIGTGSGCIAISLAKNLPNAKIYAIDVSSKALKIAKNNAKNNNVNVEFIESDILKLTELPSNFDAIVSNPPYVRKLEKEQMHKNVLANEPHLALFVENNNPLLFYDKIADLAKKNLSKNGDLYFEINQYFGKETAELLALKGFKNIELKKDIFRVDRMIKASVMTDDG